MWHEPADKGAFSMAGPFRRVKSESQIHFANVRRHGLAEDGLENFEVDVQWQSMTPFLHVRIENK
jgi:hypothetical protein